MTREPDIAQAARQLSKSVSGLMESVSGFVGSRLNTLGGSMEAEQHRGLWVLASGCALVMLLGFGILFIGVAIVAIYWDTHRVLAALSVAAGFFVLAGIAGWVLWAKRRRNASVIDWLPQVVMLFAQFWRLRR